MSSDTDSMRIASQNLERHEDLRLIEKQFSILGKLRNVFKRSTIVKELICYNAFRMPVRQPMRNEPDALFVRFDEFPLIHLERYLRYDTGQPLLTIYNGTVYFYLRNVLVFFSHLDSIINEEMRLEEEKWARIFDEKNKLTTFESEEAREKAKRHFVFHSTRTVCYLSPPSKV